MFFPSVCFFFSSYPFPSKLGSPCHFRSHSAFLISSNSCSFFCMLLWHLTLPLVWVPCVLSFLYPPTSCTFLSLYLTPPSLMVSFLSFVYFLKFVHPLLHSPLYCTCLLFHYTPIFAVISLALSV